MKELRGERDTFLQRNLRTGQSVRQNALGYSRNLAVLERYHQRASFPKTYHEIVTRLLLYRQRQPLVVVLLSEGFNKSRMLRRNPKTQIGFNTHVFHVS